MHLIVGWTFFGARPPAAAVETVPGTGEAAKFPAETLGTHKDGNTEHKATSTGSPTATPGNGACSSCCVLLCYALC
jgi:hypothetical protein